MWAIFNFIVIISLIRCTFSPQTAGRDSFNVAKYKRMLFSNNVIFGAKSKSLVLQIDMPWCLAAMMDIKICKQHCVAICNMILADGDVESQPGPRKRRSILSRSCDRKKHRIRNAVDGDANVPGTHTSISENNSSDSDEQTADHDYDCQITDTGIRLIRSKTKRKTRESDNSGQNMEIRTNQIESFNAQSEMEDENALPGDSRNMHTKDITNSSTQLRGSISQSEHDTNASSAARPKCQDTEEAGNSDSDGSITDYDCQITVTGIRLIRSKRKRRSSASHKQTFRSRRPRNKAPSTYKAAREYSNATCPENDIGTFNVECQSCGALHFSSDSPGTNKHVNVKCFPDCCCNGTVEIKAPQPPIGILNDLYMRNHPKSTHFLENIRQYNSSLAFASMIAKTDLFSSQGPYSYSIHGQIYHNIGSLKGTTGQNPCYAQLYIMDSDLATEVRYANNHHNLDKYVLRALESDLCSCNPFAKSLKMMKDVIETQNNVDSDSAELMMIFDINRNLDQRRYNVAAENEIAAVFASEDGELPPGRATVFRTKGDRLTSISHLNPDLDAMTYPLLFPHGDQGWGPDMKLKNTAHLNRDRLTLLKFYAYRISARIHSFLHLSGKLFQQYVVDSFCKVEQNTLNYIKNHQPKLRAESYKGLMEHLNNEATSNDAVVGRKVILPSSFQGGLRNMQQLFQDAMSVVSRIGKPDLFLTFTCNPNWKEISSNLKAGQKTSDRPDLSAKVFRRKLDCLLRDIFHYNIFGKTKGHIGVIEFQKRGLSHAHILITLDDKDKFATDDEIDNVISAEIPDCDADPVLRELVLKHMIHGPCGEHNLQSPCMTDGVCERSFPKQLANKTKVMDGEFPTYRRRRGAVAVVGRHTIDNRWVVPYSPYLLKKYNAHINLEICASFKSVKYHYKYIFKGHDAASIEFRKAGNSNILDYDEIKTYLEARYLGAQEACWRLFKYPMHFKSHAVYRLSLHLEDMQNVVFAEGNEDEAAASAADKFTTLTALFEINRKWCHEPKDSKNPKDPRNYLYKDMPSAFTFNKSYGWAARQKRHNVIGRMHFVSPKDSERYHLRLLLMHRKGCVGFESLRTINDIKYPTFKEAAKALGLVEDDKELENTLKEASETYMPSQLRRLFGDIVSVCVPKNPEKLWADFLPAMTEDFVRNGFDMDTSTAMAYEHIKADLEDQLEIESLITPPRNLDESRLANYYDQQRMSMKEMGETMYESLNDEQRGAADIILNALQQSEKNRCFFVDGPEGTGKTYLYRTLNSIFRGMGKSVVNIAWSGIAAQLLFKGRTAHNVFKLPVPTNKETFMPNVHPSSKQAKFLKHTDIIIWNEAPMSPKYAIEGVDELLRDICRNYLPFGGKLVLFGGDFRQVPPVTKESNNSSLLEFSLKRSKIWKLLTKLQLTTNMRAKGENAEFIEFLLRVGNGTEKTNDEGEIKIPEKIRSDGDLIYEIYGDDINLLKAKDIYDSAILCSTNEECNSYNESILMLVNGGEKTYFSIDEAIIDGEQSPYPIEFINSLTPPGLPPHELKLKKGAVVMLLRNLNVSKGLCNGTRLIVRELGQHVICCEKLETGEQVLIPRVQMHPCDTELPFTLNRKQFPLKLSYAMTIHKSQGQTFKKVGVYLPHGPFTHGQLYVALSRCTTEDGLKVYLPELSTEVKNITIDELLMS